MQDTQEMRVDPWVGKIPWRRKWQSVPAREAQSGRRLLGTYGVSQTDFIFLGSKITVDSDCSNKIKRHLFLGRKAMKNLGPKARPERS